MMRATPRVPVDEPAPGHDSHDVARGAVWTHAADGPMPRRISRARRRFPRCRPRAATCEGRMDAASNAVRGPSGREPAELLTRNPATGLRRIKEVRWVDKRRTPSLTWRNLPRAYQIVKPCVVVFLSILLARCPCGGRGCGRSSCGGVSNSRAYQPGRRRFRAAADCSTGCSKARLLHNFYWLGAAQFHRMLQARTCPSARTLCAAAAMDAHRGARHCGEAGTRGTRRATRCSDTLWMKIDGNRCEPCASAERPAASQQGARNGNRQSACAVFGRHVPVSHAKKRAWRETLTTLLLARSSSPRKRSAGPDPSSRWDRAVVARSSATYELLGQRAEAADYFERLSPNIRRSPREGWFGACDQTELKQS